VKALVTGAAGFIGSSIARALIARGDEVRGFDNLSTGFEENVPGGVELHRGDLADLEAVEKATAGTDVVFHQAALRSVELSVDDPVASDRSNVLGTLHVLLAAQQAGVRRVVYASSSSVYGDPPGALRVESELPQPVSPYGVSKLAGEYYCRAWTALHGLSTVSLRYFNVFGPRQHPESRYALVFPAFISALVSGRAPELHWDGEQSRDFTYIDDVVRANLLAAETGPAVDGEIVNIGAGRAKTVNEVLRAVSEAVGTWIDPVRKPKRPGDVRHTLADITKARTLLGWEPRAEWDEAVRACVDWFRSAGPEPPGS
jgi:nucleoside-diphosphate-sugar epimerase